MLYVNYMSIKLEEKNIQKREKFSAGVMLQAQLIWALLRNENKAKLK